jgi:hypothetical protein
MLQSLSIPAFVESIASELCLHRLWTFTLDIIVHSGHLPIGFRAQH